MKMLKRSLSVAAYNFRGWAKNPRIIITFALAFILCFLLSDKAVKFAREYGTTMQIVEAFVWTFGDTNSILLYCFCCCSRICPSSPAGRPFT